MRINSKSHKNARAGFVIGELLIAVLLLAVAVSSLAALMYSVSRRTGASRSEVACASTGGAGRGKCAPQSGAGGPSKLLRSGCVVRAGMAFGGCDDPLTSPDSSDETVVRSRTDSASLALIAKKQKALRDSGRPDRGFIR